MHVHGIRFVSYMESGILNALLSKHLYLEFLSHVFHPPPSNDLFYDMDVLKTQTLLSYVLFMSKHFVCILLDYYFEMCKLLKSGSKDHKEIK